MRRRPAATVSATARTSTPPPSAGLGGQRAGRADLRDADGGAAGRPVSARFVARAHRRLAERLETSRLHHRAQGRAERPGRAVRGRDPDQHRLQRPRRRAGRPGAGRRARHHPHPRRAAGPAGGGLLAFVEAIRAVGVLDDWRGIWSATTTRSWAQFDAQLAESGSAAPTSSACRRHRTCTPSGRPGPGRSSESCAKPEPPSRTPRPMAAPITDPDLLTDLHSRYDKAVTWESSPADTATGKTTRTTPAMSWPADCGTKPTRSGSGPSTSPCPGPATPANALGKRPNSHQKVSGYWHTLATAARYCQVRSYLISARNHGVRPIDAIRKPSPEPLDTTGKGLIRLHP